MFRYLPGLLLLVFSGAATAGDVEYASVDHRDGVYFLVLNVTLEAGHDAVMAIVTDHENLHRVSDVIVETHLLDSTHSQSKRRKLVTRTCILVFCFKAIMVEDIEETADSIITRIVATESDFKSGATVWRVQQVDAGHSRIEINSELEPAFWIPPFIGPLLLKNKMLFEAKKTIRNIESLASHG